ncbi:hypothetical protein [Streptomyces sp. Ncost-T10-10d]|uniref:hypothetical protein n=1 Tax=Streptomyces sp. Ncost-T10-10d TaxID=1839774 RepID=UPI00081D9826|nr:hypothetical protein [Streptomyces sp. Ncost-T10-10d]SCF57662.1 hypothetical protein GA0115254_104212 [Streptomyces sp. Ncost-T10-10d]
MATTENTLRPHRHEKDTLEQPADHRTGGVIGSLAHLIRAAVITAILDGSKLITKSTLKSFRNDHHNESSDHTSAPEAGPR